MNEKKSKIGLTVFNQYLYAFGGYEKQNSDHPCFNTIERLDLRNEMTANWEIIPRTLPYPVSSPGIIPINKKELILLGGWNGANMTKSCIVRIPENGDKTQYQVIQRKDEKTADFFDQCNVFAMTEDGKLAFPGHFAMHLMNPQDFEFESKSYS